jgi:4-amino-4-deoxy-L-arabinose transferase-like glycosyltransferase
VRALPAGAWIFLVALVLRVAAVLLPPEPPLSPNAVGAFVGGALRLLDGEGFRDPSYPMFSPPLYALGIAASFAAFGHHTLPIRLAQAALDAGTALLVFAIGSRVFGRRTGIAAGVLAAIYPFTIYSVTEIGTEASFSFALTAFVWVSLQAVTSARWTSHAAVGLLLGIASLIRGSTQFYPAAWGATLWLMGRRDAAALARFALACACFVAVIAPWTLRNWLVLDSFIPLSTSSAPLLCGADEEFFVIEAREDRMQRYFDRLEARGWSRPDHGDTLGWERFYARAALEKYRERFEAEGVLGTAAFFAKKFLRLWYATESGTRHGLVLALNLPFYALGLAGVLMAWRRRVRLAWLPAMPVIYLAALHTVVYAYFRYIEPVMPLLLCFTGYAAAALLERRPFARLLAPRSAQPVG